MNQCSGRTKRAEPAILTAVWAELMRLGETEQMSEDVVHGLCVTLYLHGWAAGRKQKPDKKSKNS